MEAPTHVAAGSRISGQVETSGDVRVDGRVEGNIRAGGTVTIASGGVAVAEIHATRAEVRGCVIGNVIAGDRIEVASGARVVGDLRAPAVEIEPGATIEGRIDRRLPDAEGEAGSRTTARLRGLPLLRPSRPMVALPGAEERPRPPPPAPPVPATRARLVPRRRAGEKGTDPE